MREAAYAKESVGAMNEEPKPGDLVYIPDLAGKQPKARRVVKVADERLLYKSGPYSMTHTNRVFTVTSGLKFDCRTWLSVVDAGGMPMRAYPSLEALMETRERKYLLDRLVSQCTSERLRELPLEKLRELAALLDIKVWWVNDAEQGTAPTGHNENAS